MTNLNLTDWLSAMSEAVSETASQTFSCEALTNGAGIRNDPSDLPQNLLGSFISLVGENDSVQVGLIAHKESLQTLAKIMLGMGNDEAIADSDMADAVGEIVNIVAGGVKRRLNEASGGLKLGLPIFVEGRISTGESQKTIASDMKIGDVPVHILVVGKKG